jgi:hypothetical protein
VTNLIKCDAVDLPHLIAWPGGVASSAFILTLYVSVGLIRPRRYLVCHRQFSTSMIFSDTASAAV